MFKLHRCFAGKNRCLEIVSGKRKPHQRRKLSNQLNGKVIDRLDVNDVQATLNIRSLSVGVYLVETATSDNVYIERIVERIDINVAMIPELEMTIAAKNNFKTAETSRKNAINGSRHFLKLKEYERYKQIN